MALASGTKDAIQNLVNMSGMYSQAVGMTPDKIKENAAIQKKGGKVIETIVTAPFDIVGWLINNWQLAVIGAVAILVLIRD